jgi:hypothetical protein
LDPMSERALTLEYALYGRSNTHKLERAFSKAGFSETDGLSKFKAIDFLSSIEIDVTNRSSTRIATWLRATKELQLDNPRDYLATIAANSAKNIARHAPCSASSAKSWKG